MSEPQDDIPQVESARKKRARLPGRYHPHRVVYPREMNLKSVLGWIAVAFVIWWIIETPDGAAHVVHNVAVFLTSMARGLSRFFASI